MFAVLRILNAQNRFARPTWTVGYFNTVDEAVERGMVSRFDIL
jgi:hypothetical protein